MLIGDKKLISSVLTLLALGACGGGGGGGGDGNTAPEPTSVSMAVLSSRADTVSDGSALIEIKLSDESALANLKVTAGERDVSSAFAKRSSGRVLGIVSGLEAGRVMLSASITGRSATATLPITSYSKNGPMFSGPQQSPWICQTADFRLPDGTTLGPPKDASCNADTRINYVYKPAGGADFKPLPSLTQLPTDVSQTTLSTGAVVNYIVRLETGTLNRAIYQVGVLHDPTKDAPIGPFSDIAGWNGKLIYTFGGGAQVGYIQGTSTGGVLTNPGLGLGFAIATSSLNVFGNNASDPLSAETMSMVKSRFIQTYGLPKATIGFGQSGGSMQQHLISNNYPGLLDAIMPSLSWPDLMTVVPMVTDCSLLERAFSAGTEAWEFKEKSAVAGFASWSNCDNGPEGLTILASDWKHMYAPHWLVATRSGPIIPNCPIALADQYVYEPWRNPAGARCDVFTASKNLLGTDPATGVVRRPLDNVGVQYGLAAFQSGVLSAEKFVQLNENVGGYDRDGTLVPQRTSATISALTAAYEGGRVAQQQGTYAIPIIDYRAYTEKDPDLHDSLESWKVRARLYKANGTFENQVIVRGKPFGSARIAELMLQMDKWLDNIAADAATPASRLDRIIRNRPPSLTNGCYAADGRKIVEPSALLPTGECSQLYPIHATPRQVAGADMADAVLKCELKPLQRLDYAHALTDVQFARLQSVFPSGVCDFEKPGIGQVPLKATWLSYMSPGAPIPLGDN